MVTFGAKGLFGMALLTLIASVGYGLATNDGSATTALGFIAVGAFVLGLLVVFADPDRAPWYAPDTPVAQQSPEGGRPSLPSAWPLAGALALGVLVVAAATDAVVVITAAILLTAVAVGWLFQAFTEHPAYSPRLGARLRERLVLPVGLPLGVLALVAVIAISLSRVFLALPENGTRAVALAVAIVILASAFAVAASERMGRTALALLCVFAIVAAVGAGVAGIVAGERHFDIPNTKPFHGAYPPGLNPALLGSASTGAGSHGSTTSTSSTTTGP